MTLTILSVVLYLMQPTSTTGRAFRNIAPCAAILSLHTTTLSIPIPKLLEILTTFMVLYLEIFLVPTPSTIGRTAQNSAKWITILSIHPSLFAILAFHSLIQIQIVHKPLNLVIQLSLVKLCLQWPRFYYSLFKTKQNRGSILKIITNPVPRGGTKACKPSNTFVCLNQTFFCLSLYQTQGAYTHLDQRPEKDIDEAVAAATTAVFYDDPLHLAIPYTFSLERLPGPPDGFSNQCYLLHL